MASLREILCEYPIKISIPDNTQLTWYLIQIPDTQPDPTRPKIFFQYPNPTRPEVEKPYPSDPGRGQNDERCKLLEMRQQISFAGTKSSAKRPKTILTNMFCNLHKYNLYKHDFAIYTIQFCNFPIYLSIYTICNSGNFLPLAANPAPNRFHKIFFLIF